MENDENNKEEEPHEEALDEPREEEHGEEEEEEDEDEDQDEPQEEAVELQEEEEVPAEQEDSKADINVEEKIDSNPDPVILELLKMLEESLPNAKPGDIFKYVRRLQRVFDTIMTLPMEYFLAHACITPQSEEYIDKVVNEMKEYISLTEEKRLKMKKLEASTAKLDLKREQYKLVTSLNLDDCMDRISRHNHLMSKK